MRLSVVIPAFNEEGNIARLIEETFVAVPKQSLGEVIAIDDASDDQTGAEIKALLQVYPALRYLRHSQRAGQSAPRVSQSAPATSYSPQFLQSEPYVDQ